MAQQPIRRLVAVVLSLVFWGGMSPLFSWESLYLSFYEDPSSSIAVCWIENLQETNPSHSVRYRSDKQEKWQEVQASSMSIENIQHKIVILRDLSPDTRYDFQVGQEDKELFFYTLPNTCSRPIRLAIGGDIYGNMRKYQDLALLCAAQGPDGVLLGGDIAYAHRMWNRGSALTRWRSFFRNWYGYMRGPKGNLLPLYAAPGNHDFSPEKPYFLRFFPKVNDRSYGRLVWGQIAELFVLDTGHISPMVGEQAAFLEKNLAVSSARYKIALYHIAAYPSVYSAEKKNVKKVQQIWVPLFDRYGLQLALEHHNHAYKRTYPLRSGSYHPAGVVYIGDGAWGVSPRKTHAAPYLEKTASVRCISFLTIEQEKLSVDVLSEDNSWMDHWEWQEATP